jgi:hypothetical protein
VPSALAYYNHGRWVVDCPHEGCFSALAVESGGGVTCAAPPAGCGRRYEVEWPANAPTIERVLAVRPEQNRNWFPEGHPLATAVGWPTGQTPDDLREETRTFAPELGTVALSDEDAEILGPILRKYDLVLTRDLKHVKER